MQTDLPQSRSQRRARDGALAGTRMQKAYRGILSDALLDARDADAGTERIRTGIETKPEFEYFVLEEDGNIVGVSVIVSVRGCRSARCVGNSGVLHPSGHTGAGLGADDDGAYARRHSGYRFARRAVVLRDNHHARSFYERMGFQTDGAAKTLEFLENAATVRYRYTQ